MELLNFIGGEFIPSESKKTFEKLSPFDGQVIATAPASDAMDFLKALQFAKKASAAFKSSTLEDRIQILEKLNYALITNAEEISYQESLHQGLTQTFVKEFCIDYSSKIIKETIAGMAQPQTLSLNPVGVLGVITPWTCSLRLVLERVIPALAAGNAVIVKVSELSPITAKILGDLAIAAGVPAGVLQVLHGDSSVAELLASHPGVRAISAVGKQSTIESIAKAGSAQLKKLQLSGGAKNAAIVLADADYENKMADIFKPFLVGQGQMCWNTSRLFIPEAQAPAFMEKAKAFIEGLKPLQDPRGSEMWMPLVQKNHQDVLVSKTQEAVQEHGKKIVGGDGLAAGFHVRPILMLDLHQCSVLQQDEVPGSLILVTPVKYQHEAVKWANTSYLGHSAVVFGSAEKVVKVAGQLEVAYVGLNTWGDKSVPSIMGIKQSSFGNLDMAWNGSFYSDVKKLADV